MEEQTLYPNKTKSILFLLLVLVFFVIGIYMILDGASMGWFVAITFGLGTLVFIANLLPGASYLKLDAEGFETCSLFRKHRYHWEEVNGFGVGSISGNKMVMFNFSPTFERAKSARKVSSAIAGAEGGLHDTFGMKAQALADLMNEYKLQHSQGVENQSQAS